LFALIIDRTRPGGNAARTGSSKTAAWSASMTEDDYARTLNELDRLLNDPDVPLRPGLIWRLLDKVSEQDPARGTMLSQILADQTGPAASL
jgi:hypothetical protein